MCRTLLKMRITCKQKCMRIVDREMGNCSVSKVEIISLALTWLMVLRSALKMHDQLLS